MRTLPFTLIVFLCGCMPAGTPAGSDLGLLSGGRIASQPQDCIPARTGDSLRAVDSMTLAYGSGPTIYLNRLGASCPGLRELSTIIAYDPGGHYCRGDRIRAVEPDATIPGPTCILGSWTTYKRP